MRAERRQYRHHLTLRRPETYTVERAQVSRLVSGPIKYMWNGGGRTSF